MKFTIERAPFIRALAHIQTIVERRNTIPILSNVKITANQNITLTATDLDIEAVEVIQDAKIDVSGEITVSAQLIGDIAKKMPEGCIIGIELKDHKLIVKAGRSRFSLPTIPADDFPTFPFKADHTFMISGDDLISAIDRTKFAMSQEETRYYLQGLFWNKTDDGLAIVATDGSRLSEQVVKVAYDGEGMIVPRKAILELRKIISGGDITIHVGGNKIRFIVDNVTLTSKLIDGTFPDYKRVIPKNNDKIAKVDADQLRLAIERVGIVASDKTRTVRLALAENLITVSVVSPDNGAASEDVPCEYAGEGFEIGFNSVFLRDVLAVVDDTAVIALNDKGSPALINDRFVVMPMRI